MKHIQNKEERLQVNKHRYATLSISGKLAFDRLLLTKDLPPPVRRRVAERLHKLNAHVQFAGVVTVPTTDSYICGHCTAELATEVFRVATPQAVLTHVTACDQNPVQTHFFFSSGTP